MPVPWGPVLVCVAIPPTPVPPTNTPTPLPTPTPTSTPIPNYDGFGWCPIEFQDADEIPPEPSGDDEDDSYPDYQQCLLEPLSDEDLAENVDYYQEEFDECVDLTNRYPVSALVRDGSSSASSYNIQQSGNTLTSDHLVMDIPQVKDTAMELAILKELMQEAEQSITQGYQKWFGISAPSWGKKTRLLPQCGTNQSFGDIVYNFTTDSIKFFPADKGVKNHIRHESAHAMLFKVLGPSVPKWPESYRAIDEGIAQNPPHEIYPMPQFKNKRTRLAWAYDTSRQIYQQPNHYTLETLWSLSDYDFSRIGEIYALGASSVDFISRRSGSSPLNVPKLAKAISTSSSIDAAVRSVFNIPLTTLEREYRMYLRLPGEGVKPPSATDCDSIAKEIELAQISITYIEQMLNDPKLPADRRQHGIKQLAQMKKKLADLQQKLGTCTPQGAGSCATVKTAINKARENSAGPNVACPLYTQYFTVCTNDPNYPTIRPKFQEYYDKYCGCAGLKTSIQKERNKNSPPSTMCPLFGQYISSCKTDSSWASFSPQVITDYNRQCKTPKIASITMFTMPRSEGVCRPCEESKILLKGAGLLKLDGTRQVDPPSTSDSLTKITYGVPGDLRGTFNGYPGFIIKGSTGQTSIIRGGLSQQEVDMIKQGNLPPSR